MNCEKCLDLISARLDGNLPPQDETDLNDHLQICPACRAIAKDMKHLHCALADVGEVDAPPELSQAVMAKIKEEKRRSSRRLVRQLIGLAACLVLCIGVVRVADATISEHNHQRGASDPAPLSLVNPEPEHYSFSNDQYLRVCYGNTPATPTARIIGSTQSLADFLTQFPQDDLSALTEAYPEAFFRTGRLLAVVVEEPSGSNRHKLESQGLQSDSVTVIRQIPQAGDCAMAAWLILAEVGEIFSDGDVMAVIFSE